MDVVNDTKQFLLAAGQTPAESPKFDLETRRLRANLILEECAEVIQALGFVMAENSQGEIILEQTDLVDPVEIVDGLVDLTYVTVGAAVHFGLPFEAAWDEVQATNMAKFGPGGYKDENGKWRKPPGWVAPNLEKILKEHGYEPSQVN